MATQGRKLDELFWHQFAKDFPAAADYFSPAVTAMQKEFEVGSKEILRSIGEAFGRRAAETLSGLEPTQAIAEISRMWERTGTGELQLVNGDPLTLMVSNCRVCGQLAGTGGMFECGFHEGFFRSALGGILGKNVNLHQETNFEGEAGTWCRKFVTDAKI